MRIRTLPGDRMRRGARTLRWCALLLATITVVGSWLTTYTTDERASTPTARAGRSSASSSPACRGRLGFAGIVLAASFIVAAYAARLDLEQSLADASEPAQPARLGRLTTIASCVLRAMTTTAGVSGDGFSSRCGVYGGTNT